MRKRQRQTDCPVITETAVRELAKSLSGISEICSPNSSLTNFNYLNSIGVHEGGGARVLDNNAIQELWNNPRALQVLYVEIALPSSAGDGLLVRSTIYIGNLTDNLHPHSGVNEFSIETEKKLTDFRKLADGHHLVMLYALVLDAMETGKSRDVIVSLLQVALHTAADLETHGYMNGDLLHIRSGLTTIEESFK